MLQAWPKGSVSIARQYGRRLDRDRHRLSQTKFSSMPAPNSLDHAHASNSSTSFTTRIFHDRSQCSDCSPIQHTFAEVLGVEVQDLSKGITGMKVNGYPSGLSSARCTKYLRFRVPLAVTNTQAASCKLDAFHGNPEVIEQQQRENHIVCIADHTHQIGL